MSVQIEQLINMNYVKYDTLSVLINNQFRNSSADELNIFIDLNSLIKPLTRFKFNNLAIDYSDFRLSACILNMIAHYRRFFRTRYNVSTNFYLVYNTSDNSVEKKICHDYSIYNIMDNNLYNYTMRNLCLCNELCDYIPNTSLIMGNAEVCSLIDIIVEKLTDGNVPNMVITKDIVTYQVLKSCDCILRPKKSNGQDISYMINKDSLLDCFCMMERKLVEEYFPSSIYTNINIIEFLSFILSITKLPERNLKSLVPLKTVLKILNSSIGEGKIMNKYKYDISDNLMMLVAIYPKKFGDIYHEIISRYKVIDLNHQKDRFVNTPQYTIAFQPHKNYYDPVAFQQVVQNYFSNSNPIQLEDLDY